MSAAGSLDRRLCRTLVADVLHEMEHNLLEAKAARFLADQPWPSGKRLRPILFLLASGSVAVERAARFEPDGRESRLAAAIELLHEASLVHDDIVDRSPVRRGTPTVQAEHGDSLALLIGDYMVFRGLKLMLEAAESGRDIILARELADTGLQTAHGEIEQLYQYLHRREGTRDMGMDAYLEVVRRKTAGFFAGCAEGGAALAGADRELRLAYRHFGMELGIAFQMVDDLMDVLGDPAAARKSLRSNLAEGAVTLPMVHAHALHAERPAVARLAAGDELTARQEASLYALLGADDVRDACLASIDRHAARAEHALDAMPANIYRVGMADLLDYVRRCPWGGMDIPAPGAPPEDPAS